MHPSLVFLYPSAVSGSGWWRGEFIVPWCASWVASRGTNGMRRPGGWFQRGSAKNPWYQDLWLLMLWIVYIYIHYGIYIYDNCIYTKYTICWIVHHLVQSLWYYIWVLKMNIWETNWGFMVCSCFKCLVIWRNVISSAMWQCVHVSVN
jgi:hypothetical protein